MEDLKKLYPNSFDRLGSLKGAYNIRIDPSVKPATHARRKVPIMSKEAIDRELDYLIEEEIITEQVEPTRWVSSVTFPRKPNRDVRVCLDPSNLNKAIIREHHKPMTVEEIAHELAGATVYTKADALKAFLQIHLTHEASLLTMFNSHQGRLRFLWMPFGAKMSQDMFQLRMDAILEQCPGVIGIHDDMVIFGVDQEDHDANLINLLNVCQKDLVLNSKKLELRRERVTFFGAEYSGTRHASRPQEGPRDHRDDSARGQATTSVFSRYGQLHGDIHSQTSHITLNHYERCLKKEKRVSLGRSTKHGPFSKSRKQFKRTLLSEGWEHVSYRSTKERTSRSPLPARASPDAETRYANIERKLLAIVFACPKV